MEVLKFGGSSVGSAKRIRQVVDILDRYAKNGNVIGVVSAVGGITDKLLNAGQLALAKDEDYITEFENIKTIHLSIVSELIPNEKDTVLNYLNEELSYLKNLLNGIYLINELTPKTSDKLTSFGELMSSFIITEVAKRKGIDAVRKNSQNLIVTNSNFTKAEVNYFATNSNIKAYFKTPAQLTILPGFVSKSNLGEITTLGRGGSDFTASIVAAALKVKQLEIWTDVSGMYTANPKLVKQAVPIEVLSYQEAMELSHFGAKVLFPPTVQPALDSEIPILIKNTLKPEDKGTLIKTHVSTTSGSVSGITSVDDIALLTLEGNGMVGIPGFSKRLFEVLALEKINVIFITQASSEHSICFGISESDADLAVTSVNECFEYEISTRKIRPVSVEKDMSIVALVGDRMKNHQGISGKMFSALGKNNINVRAIAQGASEKNISAVIFQKDVKKALNSLHESFFEVKTKQLNVFVTGVGNVGQRLLSQIEQQRKFLKNELRINLRVIGISNSKKMYFDEDGIDLVNWKENLENGETSSLDGFLKKVTQLNKRNSIFIDITANEAVSKMYAEYLKRSISVVACNKIACSSDFENYKNLKDLAKKYNASFLFETNVGAGLPIIDTLNNLVASGDKVTTIQAVLSGSLNFVFNNFNSSTKFHDVVKEAQKEGFTEPDPRIDLSGIDVARKILILARESGYEMNLEDIANESFLTKANLESNTVDDFFETLIKDEDHFQKLFSSAQANNSQLKYVAEFNDGQAKVGLKEIPQGHPFYNLEGKDNIVMFYSHRYPEQPIIVKGAGAGADVTASGLFADIIRVSNK
ncbi:bifunctional aspartate kinase/homoserine dehydrogenase I [Psychroflexus montanilacus]|uniref:bifunctional aspartate kinase/homoserine dehydrogenase I n=1 Tax=Psychroflexus montanilacus TaxID=2873598 RepID=UPI001CCC9028|nr:bifunctional aspartate kinase/homoserine dehydrogenase I [Psychroflexus montanilacus]MBZ9650777.1 bifunctional aspartate kinase/homoserine dehydrogenase I [Psychroflexus montanilacus]